MPQRLSNTQLFRNIPEECIRRLLVCLKAREKSFKKGCPICMEGFSIKEIGVVLSGCVIMEFIDALGTNHILRVVKAGGSFGEEYACGSRGSLLHTVRASEDSDILFLDASVLLRPCEKNCSYHQKLIENLVYVSVSRSLQLMRKVLHSSPKTIRERLISYLSERVKWNGSYEFDIEFSRQQLADYLNVDRSALCNELSKMHKEGLVTYRKNHFVVHMKLDN